MRRSLLARIPRPKIGTLLGVWIAFWPYSRMLRGLLAGALGSTLTLTMLRLLQPWPLKWVLDGALIRTGDSTASLPSFLFERSPQMIVLIAAGTVLAIAALSALATYGQRYLGAKLGQTLVYRMRRDLFRHIHRLALHVHDRTRTGDLVLRLTQDMSLVRNLLVRASLRFISQSFVVVAVAALMLWIDWRLGLAALSIVPLLAWSGSRSSRRVRSAVRKQRRRESEIAATSAESIGSAALVKLHGAEETERSRFQASHRRSFRSGLRATRLQAAFERQVELLVAIGTCLVLGVGSLRVLAGSMTAGDLVLAISYLGLLYKPVRTFSRLLGHLAKGVVAAGRVREVFARPTEDLHDPSAQRPEPLRGHIRFEGVSFEYEPGIGALHEIDLEIQPGERVALVGRSGAGKTTIARLIPRLYPTTSGTLRIDGFPIEDIVELAFLRDRIAFVLQETILQGVSVWDNIAYGRDDLPAEQVIAAARRFEIHDRIERLPDGYKTILGESGTGLSGGERQRLALARAFVRAAPIVILDEPDTFLDPRVRADLWKAIDELTQGKTAICVVHDVRRAALWDRIVVVDRGRIVGSGSHDRLLAECEEYRALCAAGAPDRVVRHAAS